MTEDVLPASAADQETSSPRFWLPEMIERIAAHLRRNDVALHLRLVNRAAAAALHSPQFATVHLSEPVPHADFARRWTDPRALRPLTWQQRRRLLALTARSGDLVNLTTLLAMDERFPAGPDVMEAAAGAGHLAMTQALRQRGCPWSEFAVKAAAGGGHSSVCEWLVASACPWSDDAPGDAAAGGHVGLMDWLLGVAPASNPVPNLFDLLANWLPAARQRVCVPYLLEGAALGCEVTTLQRLYGTWVGGNATLLDFWDTPGLFIFSRARIMSAAAASRSPDWQAKLEWLEAQGFERQVAVTPEVLRRADWHARLDWLRAHGYGGDLGAARAAASLGDAEALRILLASAAPPGTVGALPLLEAAAEHGHVHVLELLDAMGYFVGDRDGEAAAPMLRMAARQGHLRALAWLADRLVGPRDLGQVRWPSEELFAAGAASGSVEVMEWLRSRRCRWDASAFAAAAQAGSEEALEWLAAQGCPIGDRAQLCMAAALRRDGTTLRVLYRLGCLPKVVPAEPADAQSSAEPRRLAEK